MKKFSIFILLIAALLASCDPAATPTATATSAPVTLNVFAAASLTGAFTEIANDFQAAYPYVTVKLNFAGSQTLATQIQQGAQADVFASADHKNMDPLVTANLVASAYRDFATNQLVVILPANNPANVQTLQDLAKPGLKLILCDKSVPCGNYALQILANLSKDPAYGTDYSAKVLANVVSNETDVKQVVTKVGLGEADAGIVYVTDAIAAPALKTVPIPSNFNVIAKYPLAALNNAPNPATAAAFVAYVLSAGGQAVLKKWGFLPPAVP